MNLVRFSNPHYSINRNLVDELFNSFSQNDYHEDYLQKYGKQPATNIFETENDFKIELLIPGLKKEDVLINYQNNLLTIKVNKEMEKENANDDYKYARREFGIFNFEKQFSIPKTVNSNEISANFENGILTVILPKKVEKLEKKSVEIKIA